MCYTFSKFLLDLPHRCSLEPLKFISLLTCLHIFNEQPPKKQNCDVFETELCRKFSNIGSTYAPVWVRELENPMRLSVVNTKRAIRLMI
jgi:hypothetical protein